ncbi:MULTISPECIES: hypothetical protein [unclassified Microcoleus]
MLRKLYINPTDYEVLYHQFDRPHAVPVAIARRALKWFTEASPIQI